VTDPAASSRRFTLFVYGTLLSGEPGHALLEGAIALGAATTKRAYDLYDLGPYPALVDGGATAVVGEAYEVTAPLLAAIDVHEEVPRLFKRRRIELEDGRGIEAYLLDRDQVRGRRRIRSGDWRARFRVERAPGARDGALVSWARKRER
jgi:gamma-glutamylaminecyclotransferase